jgi:hypothetical protein
MAGPGEERVVTYADRAVDGTADLVTEDRYTDLDQDGTGGGGGTAPPPLPSPFPKRIDPGLQDRSTSDHPLARALRKVAARPERVGLRLGLVDLTDGLEQPILVRHNDARFAFVASMAKIAILVAGYALREAARDAARQIVARDDADFFKQLRRAWVPEIRRYYRPEKGSRNSDPKYEEIFLLNRSKDSDPYTVSLRPQPDIGSSFYGEMILALRGGQNQGAANCIAALGYPYIQGALSGTGLGGDKGGFRLYKDYVSTANNWFKGFTNTGQEGNVRAAVELMTLYAQNRLVTAGLKDEMEIVLANSTETFGHSGDIEEGLRNRLPPEEKETLYCVGKVGYLDEVQGQTRKKADLSYIERTYVERDFATGKELRKQLRYVMCILWADDHEVVKDTAWDLDNAILEAHGIRRPGP